MFEISELKAKKLPELQEVAKALGVPKFRSMKKLDLVYQILDYQASNPAAVKAATQDNNPEETPEPKGQKERRPRAQRSDNRAGGNHQKNGQQKKDY